MKYKRFFAFGCSFTKYKWKTWADFLADELDIEYHNFALPGAGNEYIFHNIVEANEIYNFKHDDLVIVCWTNFCREDRFINDKWLCSGNVYSYNVLDKDWIDKWFDLKGAFKKTCVSIASTTNLLENTNCDFLYTSLMPMDLINHEDPFFEDCNIDRELDLYSRHFDMFLPSVVEYLFKSVPYVRNPNPQVANDNHPSETQHKVFTTEIILPALRKHYEPTISTR